MVLTLTFEGRTATVLQLLHLAKSISEDGSSRVDMYYNFFQFCENVSLDEDKSWLTIQQTCIPHPKDNFVPGFVYIFKSGFPVLL